VALQVLKYGEFNDPIMGHRIAYSASSQINRKDFGLGFNAMLDGRFVVSDEIQIMIEGELVEQQPAEATSGWTCSPRTGAHEPPICTGCRCGGWRAYGSIGIRPTSVIALFPHGGVSDSELGRALDQQAAFLRKLERPVSAKVTTSRAVCHADSPSCTVCARPVSRARCVVVEHAQEQPFSNGNADNRNSGYVRNVLEKIASREMTARLGHVFPLKDAAKAHRIVETGHSGGTVILIP
jgi:hypothetical protein